MKLSIVKGATSVIARVFIQDSASTVGAGKTGLAFNTSGLVCYRMRDDDGNAGATAISLVTMTKGTWVSGGFVEKDASNAPGWYEFGIPNAALAAGSRSLDIHFKGAAGMADLPLEIELTGWDNQDGVRGGMTALPNAAAAANGGLPTVDATNSVKIQTVHKKNTALASYEFAMFLAGTNTPATGKTVTVQRSIDGGAYGVGTLSASGVAVEVSLGTYKIDFAAADRNGNVIKCVANATGCDQTEFAFLMEP